MKVTFKWKKSQFPETVQFKFIFSGFIWKSKLGIHTFWLWQPKKNMFLAHVSELLSYFVEYIGPIQVSH